MAVLENIALIAEVAVTINLFVQLTMLWFQLKGRVK